MNDKWSFVPAINYERHGVSTFRPPEIKIEIKFDMKYKYRGYEFGLYFERQFEAHIGFPPDQYFIDEVTGKRRTNTAIFRIRKQIL